jgi:hypothetical protein
LHHNVEEARDVERYPIDSAFDVHEYAPMIIAEYPSLKISDPPRLSLSQRVIVKDFLSCFQYFDSVAASPFCEPSLESFFTFAVFKYSLYAPDVAARNKL